MNALDRYLTEREMTNAVFGRLVGASEATISRLRNGKQAPSYALVRRISEATGGSVTADAFLERADSASAGAAA